MFTIGSGIPLGNGVGSNAPASQIVAGSGPITPGVSASNGGLIVGNVGSQIGNYSPGQPNGTRYRPNWRPTILQSWNGSVALNQTAVNTQYQELGEVVDVLDLSATAVPYGYITCIPPGGLPVDFAEISRIKSLGGNLFGGLQGGAFPAGLWTFIIATTTSSKVPIFKHYGYSQ